ncbi:MAG: fibronectin type III domain-containing protein [Candidatus Woesearchaeota archaeon]
MRKGVFLGVCIVLCTIFLAYSFHSQDVLDDLTINYTFTGDSDFLYVNKSIFFNATIYNTTNPSQIFSNDTFMCFVNVSSPFSLEEMSFTNNQFVLQTEFTQTIPLAQYSIYCNSTQFDSFETQSHNFTISEQFRPIVRSIDLDNQNYSLYSWIAQPVYVAFYNLTQFNQNSNQSTLSDALCTLEYGGVEFNLSESSVPGIYANDSVYFDTFGNLSVLLSCEIDSQMYNWNQTVEVLEYKSKFEAFDFEFGSAFDSAGKPNLILFIDLLIYSHDTPGNHYYSVFNTTLNSLVVNNASGLNLNTIFSIISPSKILNFGSQGSVSRIHSIFNQGDSVILNESVFSNAAGYFLTTLDINNEGDFESMVFFRNTSVRQNYVVEESGIYRKLNATGLTDGAICYEDINKNGFFDLLLFGSTGAGLETKIYFNNGTHFNQSLDLGLGFRHGSCHIGKFLENNEINFMILGEFFTGSAFVNQLLLFNSTENLLNNQPDLNGRIPIEPLSHTDIFVADLDNSGLKDILICGQNQSGDYKTYFLKQNMTNPGFFYVLDEFDHPNVHKCSISATHLTDSTALEIAIGGIGAEPQDNQIKVYKNIPPRALPNPQPPTITNLSWNNQTNQLYIEWEPTDSMHSYNLKAMYLNQTVIMSGFYPLSTHPAQGYLGNMRYRTNVTLNNIENGLVQVGVQTFDQALRKSEWSIKTNQCQPPQGSSYWIINEYCLILNETLPALNITVTENGLVDFINDFSSPQTNITVHGQIRAKHLDVQNIIYNTTNTLTLNTSASVTALKPARIEKSNITTLIAKANSTLFDSQVQHVTVYDPYQVNDTIATVFSYINQFSQQVTDVLQNSTGVFTTNTTQTLLRQTFTNSSVNPNNITITFTKPPLYYNSTQSIQPEPNKTIILTRNPLPDIGVFQSNVNQTLLQHDGALDLQTFSQFPNFTVEIPDLARINWLHPINVSFLNLNDSIQIEENLISVNHSQLNASANITFFNLSYLTKPLLLKNGEICQDCLNQTYQDNTFSSIVSGFSTYQTQQNAQLSFETTSLAVVNQTFDIRVRYVQSQNTNNPVENATCLFETNDKSIPLSLNGSFYTNQTIFNTTSESIFANISCSALNFEPLNLTQEIQVIDNGLFFVRTDDVYEGVERSSAGVFGKYLYYQGILNSILKEYINKTLISSSFVSNIENKPFSLTDLNNDGQMQKINLGQQIVNTPSDWTTLTNGAFITADLDNDGDIDIIYCGNQRFGILENRFAQNQHDTLEFINHPYPEFGLSRCSLAYTVFNNTKYVAAQGRNKSDDNKLFLFKIEENLNLTNLSTTANLGDGEIYFTNINNDDNIELITTGTRTSTSGFETNVFTIINNSLHNSTFTIPEHYIQSSIISVKLQNETYPLIIISGTNLGESADPPHINAYQYNGTDLEKRNDLIQDVPPFSRGSAFFADITGNNLPELFITGSGTAQLFTLFDTEHQLVGVQPSAPQNLSASYNPTTQELFIEWSEVPNATYQLQVGETSRPHRFVSSATGSSTNPTQNQQGNMFSQTNITLQNMPNTCYQIRVQAISPSYIQSDWQILKDYNKRSGFDSAGKYDINCDGDYRDTTAGGPPSPLDRATGAAITPGEPSGEGTVQPPPESGSEEESQEQPQPQEPQQTQSQGSFITKPFEQFFEIEYRNERTYVIETIQKIERTKKTDIIIRKEFPTTTLQSASLLQSRTPIIIQRENPIIDFFIGDLDYLEQYRMQYSLPGTIEEHQIRAVQTVMLADQQYTQEQIELLEQEQEEIANRAVNTSITETQVGDNTVFTIRVDLQDDVDTVRNVEIEQYIPKCLIEEVNELILRTGIDENYINNVQIKEADPIIVWTFEELRAGEEFTFTLPVLRDEDCLDQTRIRTLAQDFIGAHYEINQKNLLLSLLLTAGIFLLFLLLFTSITRANRYDANYLITQQKRHGFTDEQIFHNLQENRFIEITKEQIQKHKATFTHHITTRGVEIFIFLTLVILNTLDFAGMIPGYLDWVKKIISWLLLLLLLYKVDLTKVLFNYTKQWLNVTLLGAMFLMHLQGLIQFAQALRFDARTAFVFDLYQWILANEYVFSVILFSIGTGTLLLISLYIGFFMPIREGSLYFTLSRHPHAHTVLQKIKRSVITFILLMIFFFTIFNRMMEWLAIAIDAAVFMLALIILLAAILQTKFHDTKTRTHHHIHNIFANNSILLILFAWYIGSFFIPLLEPMYAQMALGALIALLVFVVLITSIYSYKHHFQELKHVSTAVDTIYVKFVKLFEYPHTLFLGISGLLVLQHIVEIGLYLIPNITGQAGSIYSHVHKNTLFSLFGETSIVSEHLFTLSLNEAYLYSFLYLTSFLGFILLFSIPAIIWTVYFVHRQVHFTNVSLSEYLTKKTTSAKVLRAVAVVGIPFIVTALVSQILYIRQVQTLSLVGIEILAQKSPVQPTTILFLLIGMLVYIPIAYALRTKPALTYSTIWFGVATLMYMYMIPYLDSTMRYLLQTVSAPTNLESVLLLFVFVFFSIDVLIIYGLGLLILILFTLPKTIKHAIIRVISKRGPLHRMNALSMHMSHLDYFDYARFHFVGNLKHHLKHYVQAEQKRGHHLETIILQLKLHQYPDSLIHHAIEDILEDPKSKKQLTHMRPEHIDADKVKHLVPLIRKDLKHKETLLEIFEEYEDEYSYPEIKLAMRLAKNTIRGNIHSSQVKYVELQEIKEIILYLQQKEDVEQFALKGYDPSFMQLRANAKDASHNPQKAQLLTTILEEWVIKQQQIHTVIQILKDYSANEILYACDYILTHKDQREKWKQDVQKIQQMIDWIEHAKQQGLTADHIRVELQNAGWSKQQIELAFQKIHAHHIFTHTKDD